MDVKRVTKNTGISLGIVGTLVASAVGYGKNENRIDQMEKNESKLEKTLERIDTRLYNLEMSDRGIPRYRIKKPMSEETVDSEE